MTNGEHILQLKTVNELEHFLFRFMVDQLVFNQEVAITEWLNKEMISEKAFIERLSMVIVNGVSRHPELVTDEFLSLLEDE